MKKFTHGKVIAVLGFLLLVGSPYPGRAQVRPINIVTNAQGLSYVERELIVRFAPSALRRTATDDRNIQGGSLSSFLTAGAMQAVAPLLHTEVSNVDVFKVFQNATSADTLSITRLGDTIRLDDFWTILVLQLPPGACEQATADRLATSLFPLVRYAELNVAVSVLDPGSSSPTTVPGPAVAATPGIYPNPSAGDVTLACIDDPASGALTVEIYGNNGTVLRRVAFPETCVAGPRALRLPVADLPAGQYHYRLTTGQGVSVGKFVKE